MCLEGDAVPGRAVDKGTCMLRSRYEISYLMASSAPLRDLEFALP